MTRIQNRKKRIIVTSLIIFLLDQFTKQIAKQSLPSGLSVEFIPNIINIKLVKNTGAAFSLFSNSTITLTILSLIVSITLLAIIWFRTPTNTLNITGFAFLLGGTLGNGIDRLVQGFVIDFIQISFINFPIFNFADIAINIAVICFMIDTFNKVNNDR